MANQDAGQLEMDVIRFGIRITKSEIIKALETYNRIHKEKVSIGSFHKEKNKFFARTPELPSNPLGVYFFGEVKPKEVVFGYVGESSLAYLQKFYAELANGKL